MSKTGYRQCCLTKTVTGALHQKVSWIPEKYAELGRLLKLRDQYEKWEDGWRVEKVSETVQHWSDLDHQKDIREHKRSTGDSMPKD